MNIKKVTNPQPLPNESTAQTRQRSRMGTEPETWRSHGRLSAGRWKEESEGKSVGNEKHNW